MKYAKKTRTGSYKTVPDITDATDVILGIKDYEALQMKITKLKNSTHRQQSDADANIIEELERQRDAIIAEFSWSEKDNLVKHQLEIKSLQYEITELKAQKIALAQQVDDLEQSFQQQKALNKNLLRISRERANSDRSIPGKKTHSGYLVLGSAQFRERVYDYGMNDAVVMAWRTTLQTPYDASIEYDAVRAQIQADLMNGVFERLGIAVVPRTEDEDVIIDWYEKDDTGNENSVCGVFRITYAADVRGGYWTVDLYTNMPVSIPTELKPVRMIKKQKRGEQHG